MRDCDWNPNSSVQLQICLNKAAGRTLWCKYVYATVSLEQAFWLDRVPPSYALVNVCHSSSSEPNTTGAVFKPDRIVWCELQLQNAVYGYDVQKETKVEEEQGVSLKSDGKCDFFAAAADTTVVFLIPNGLICRTVCVIGGKQTI